MLEIKKIKLSILLSKKPNFKAYNQNYENFDCKFGFLVKF